MIANAFKNGSAEFSKNVKIWLSVGAENQRAKKKVGHSTSTQQGADMKCPKIAENWKCRILKKCKNLAKCRCRKSTGQKKVGHSTSTHQGADMKCQKIAENWKHRILKKCKK